METPACCIVGLPRPPVHSSGRASALVAALVVETRAAGALTRRAALLTWCRASQVNPAGTTLLWEGVGRELLAIESDAHCAVFGLEDSNVVSTGAARRLGIVELSGAPPRHEGPEAATRSGGAGGKAAHPQAAPMPTRSAKGEASPFTMNSRGAEVECAVEA